MCFNNSEGWNLVKLFSNKYFCFPSQVTSVEVVETFIARIKEVNPILNCVVDERFSEALEDARKVDEFIQSGVKSVQDIEKDTPFLGVPFSTKDCLQVTGMAINCLTQVNWHFLIGQFYSEIPGTGFFSLPPPATAQRPA
jgi:hypothetical protein